MEKTGKVVKGVWDCSQCGATKIPRDYMNCPNCGAPQGEDVSFYIADYNNYATDEEAARSIEKGPHWMCSYCGSWTEGDKEVCQSCGATRENSNKNYFDIKKKKEQRRREEEQARKKAGVQSSQIEGNAANTQIRNNTNHSFGNSERVNTNNRSNSNDIIKSRFSAIIMMFLAILAVAGIIFIAIPKEKELIISGVSWERSIQVDKYQTIHDSGWSAPSGARVTNTREEQSGTKQVEDGTKQVTEKVPKQVLDHYDNVKSYKDLGNGDFEEYVDKVPVYRTEYETVTKTVKKYKDVPVYSIKYYYDLDVWRNEKQLKTSGNDKNAYWDETDITVNNKGTSNNPKVGDLKESGRTEKYYVSATDKKGKEKKYTVDKSDWDNIEIGQTIKAKVTMGGHLKFK